MHSGKLDVHNNRNMCAHLRTRPVHVTYLHTDICTYVQFMYMPNGMGQFSFHGLCFMLQAKQRRCFVFVCLFQLKDNEKVCSSSLRCDGTKREREGDRGREPEAIR